MVNMVGIVPMYNKDKITMNRFKRRGILIFCI